ncbi:hypothetical protein [Pseudomonas putida]|uniref:hypothetical protein n=1 Tax=Pseudomonas putida TaxID=303 RepID=UPI0018D2F3BA|nr:hypothetical protein [Pseudomonas putida]
MNTVEFTRGANGKPAASAALEDCIANTIGLDGSCFFGYPLIATPEGKYFVDATFLNPDKGIILFDIVEGQNHFLEGGGLIPLSWLCMAQASDG